MGKEILNDSNNIGELVRELEQDFISGYTQTSKYVEESLFDDINKIEAYLNSKHTSGETDSLGREKPFFNICIAKKNITARATDIDRKHIIAKSESSKDLLASYLFTIYLQKWMNRTNFGLFLNNWGNYLAAYNSAIVKFIEKNGEMNSQVIPWNKLIVDVIDFDSNSVVEVLEVTPAQLKQNKAYDQEIVENLLLTLTAREGLDKTKKDTKNNYIKLYEIHGKFPLSYLTGKKRDEDEFIQQMHVISFVAGKQRGEFDDFTLFSGREKKSPYMLTWLIPSINGSISLMGSVKSLFEAQWMINHSIKAIKDQLDVSSKIVFQTADPAFANTNAFKAIESGDILVWNKDNPNGQLTNLANNSHDITALQSFGQQWQILANDITTTPDILEGNNMPSGTAYRQAAIIQQEAHFNFELMMENKGLHLEKMFKEYITPHLLKQMDTTEEISATLDTYGIDKIEKRFISNEAVKRFNYKAVEAVINKTEMPDMGQETAQVKDELSMLGGQRFIKPSEISTKTWKDIIDKFEPEIVYQITGENKDKQAVMTTLSSVFGVITQNPLVLQDPNARLLFNKILGETNAISPIELAEVKGQPQPIPIQPANQAVGQVGAGINNQSIQ